MEQFKDIDFALARLLLNRALEKRGPITYGACAKQLSDELGYSVNAHFGLTYPLLRVGNLCFDLGLPFLTAFVVHKNDITGNAAGQGFYSMVCSFRPEAKSMPPRTVWKDELARVRKCSDWSPLSDYLSRHSAT